MRDLATLDTVVFIQKYFFSTGGSVPMPLSRITLSLSASARLIEGKAPDRRGNGAESPRSIQNTRHPSTTVFLLSQGQHHPSTTVFLLSQGQHHPSTTVFIKSGFAA